jgi:acyl transferase domain-containing protein/acyl carrier protein
VLEEPPEPAPLAAAQPWQLLPLSARTPAALDAATARLAGHLRDHPELPLADVAWTLQVGRREHAYRRYAIASGTADAVTALTDPDRLVTVAGSPRGHAVAFMFPGAVDDRAEAGQPAQADPDLPGWAESDPDFRRWADECCDAAPALLAGARSALRTGQPPGDPVTADLTVFVREYALARLWIEWGAWPTAVLGTGVGALVAATVAGVFGVRDAARLVAARAGVIQAGLDDGSGPAESAARELGELAAAIGPRPPEIPIVSARHGRRLGQDEATDPAYWAGSAVGGARLERAVSGLLADLGQALIEVGAGQVLATLARGRPEFTADHLVTATLCGTGTRASMLGVLGRLWLTGMSVPWAAVHGGARRARLPLPTYPFERQRYLVDADPAVPAFGAEPDVPRPAPGERHDIAEPARQAGHRDGGDAPGIGTLVAVTRLFGHVLELPAVGAEDSFFDLGGDSLMVADLLAEVYTEFAVDFDMQSVYDAPTATAFAALIDNRTADRKVPYQPPEEPS